LLQEIAGGEISSEVVDIYPKKIEDSQVVLSFKNVTKLIGQEIPKETIKNILTSLDIKINNVTESGIGMTIPAYRNDVTRECDVIEEILRVYGYNNITFGNKLNATISHVSKYEDHKIQDVVGNQLVGQGFYEILANSLTSPAYTELSDSLNADHHVTMLNPLGQELSVLRQSLLFSGLEAIAFNQNRRRGDVKLFEFGKTYHNYALERQEDKHLSLLVAGNRSRESWKTDPSKNATDFFYLKGIVSTILEKLGISSTRTTTTKNAVFAEAVTLEVGKLPLVSYGIVKKSIIKSFSIDETVFYADFNWDNILTVASRNSISFRTIPKYPAVRRDFALLVDQKVGFDALYKLARQTEKSILKDVNLFDVYEGKNLPAGKKSYALSFLLQDEHKTLTDKQVDKVMNKLQQRFEKELGAILR